MRDSRQEVWESRPTKVGRLDSRPRRFWLKRVCASRAGSFALCEPMGGVAEDVEEKILEKLWRGAEVELRCWLVGWLVPKRVCARGAGLRGEHGRPVWDRGPGTMGTGGHPATPATNDI